MKAGINLYSLHKFIKTEADFLDTAKKVKAMGYDYAQYSGGPFNAEMIKRVSDEAELPIVLTHMPADRIVGDADKLMEEHALFGCKNIGLGSVPITMMTRMDKVCDEYLCKTKLGELNKAAGYLKENGFGFFLHNHHYEFMRMSSGERIFDYIVDECPNINFTLDTYWLQYAGVSVMDSIERLNGRIGCVHLKDYKIITDMKLGYFESFPAYENVGCGNMDFKKIVPKMAECGTEYFLVERDDACSQPDPFGEVEKSIRYIKAEL